MRHYLRILPVLLLLGFSLSGQTTTSSEVCAAYPGLSGCPGAIALTGTGTSTGLLFSSSGGFGGGDVAWYSSSLTETRSGKSRAYTLVEVRKAAHQLKTVDLPSANYVRLARLAGVDAASLDEAQVVETLKALGLPIYDYAHVDNYLYHQALAQGAKVRWVWKPTRSKDLDAVKSAANFTVTPSMGLLYPSLYGQRIPEKVLQEMASILENLPDATFLISDFEAVRPDPFLAVSTAKLLQQNRIWIVDQWDEPGFGQGPVEPVKSSPASVAELTNPR